MICSTFALSDCEPPAKTDLSCDDCRCTDKSQHDFNIERQYNISNTWSVPRYKIPR